MTKVGMLLRDCPAVRLPDQLDGMSDRIIEARFVLADAQGRLVPWRAEVRSGWTTPGLGIRLPVR